ncbi:MAG: ATP-binding protein [Pirellulales bacterium]
MNDRQPVTTAPVPGQEMRRHRPLRASRRDVARRFVVLFVPLAIAIGSLIAAFYWTQESAERALLRTREKHHVDAQSELILSDFRAVVSDLMVLSESHALHRFLEKGGLEEQAALANEYRTFSGQKRMYDQIRFLDATGRETVRVNFDSGQPSIVPKEKLQSKAGRYYFKETLRLDREDVFVSPFDLNVEQGVIEQPEKPTIRFGTPVFDQQGRKRGILVLNYLGIKLIDKLKRRAVGARGRIMLLNRDGYWLHAPRPEDAWGFMFADRHDRSFARLFPNAWQTIAANQSGQFLGADGMFTFKTVYPIPAIAEDGTAVLSLATPHGPAKEKTSEAETGGTAIPTVDADSKNRGYFWKIVSHVRPDILHARSRQLLSGLVRLSTLLAVGLAIGTWFLARFRADHQLADEALRHSESRFRQMAENIEDIFWMTSVDRCQFLYVSPSYEKIFARSCQGLLQRADDWLDAIHVEDRERVRKVFSVDGRRGDFEVEYRIMWPGGTVRWIWDRGFAIRDAEGQIERLTGIAEDTTAMKEARRQILQSERLAAIGEAMAGLAHESRNALQRSQANLERLAKRVQDRPDALALIERFQAAQRDLHALYEQVRGYAAPLRLQRKRCDIRQLLRETCQHVISGEREIVLREHGEAVHAECTVDPFAMRQVFRNILENALCDENVRGSPRERVEIDITWSDVERNGKSALSVAIRDNGPGLSPEEARRIFEPFFTTKSKGTGLGMAITRRIIEAHGGDVSVGPDSRHGAEIILTLPRTTL